MLSNYLGTNRVQNEQFDVILSQSVTPFQLPKKTHALTDKKDEVGLRLSPLLNPFTVIPAGSRCWIKWGFPK